MLTLRDNFSCEVTIGQARGLDTARRDARTPRSGGLDDADREEVVKKFEDATKREDTCMNAHMARMNRMKRPSSAPNPNECALRRSLLGCEDAQAHGRTERNGARRGRPPPNLPAKPKRWPHAERVVLLDVDGVLHASSAHGPRRFAVSCMMNLKSILDETGACLVLASTWRASTTLMALLARELEKWTIPLWVGCTCDFWDVMSKRPQRRCDEIAQWAREHASHGVSGWVSIDDDDLLSPAQNDGELAILLGHCVQTNGNSGLSTKDVALAIKILKGQLEHHGHGHDHGHNNNHRGHNHHGHGHRQHSSDGSNGHRHHRSRDGHHNHSLSWDHHSQHGQHGHHHHHQQHDGEQGSLETGDGYRELVPVDVAVDGNEDGTSAKRDKSKKERKKHARHEARRMVRSPQELAAYEAAQRRAEKERRHEERRKLQLGA